MPTLGLAKLRSIAALSTGVLPVAVQEVGTGPVPMVAEANRQPVEASIERREAVLRSTSEGLAPVTWPMTTALLLGAVSSGHSVRPGGQLHPVAWRGRIRSPGE